MALAERGDSYAMDPKMFLPIVERKDLAALQEMGGLGRILQMLKANIDQGLSQSEVQSHRELYGANDLPPPKDVPFWRRIWEGLGDTVIRVLLLCAIVSIILGMTLPDPHTGVVQRDIGWIEGTAILISIVLVVFISAFNDHQKAKKFKELSTLGETKSVEVVRDGHKHTIDSREVVVGDILLIEGGQTLSCDGVLFDSQDLLMDESSATGESIHCKKRADADCIMMSGTNVVEGIGKCIVVSVGVCSFFGVLMMKSRDEEDDDDDDDDDAPGEGAGDGKKASPAEPQEDANMVESMKAVPTEQQDASPKPPPKVKKSKKTPLQKKLDVLATRIGHFGLVGAAITVIVLSIKNGVDIGKGKDKFNIINYLKFIIVGITVVVVAIPEGLPLAVTIALAYSMKSMVDDNCLVRILASCETMGGCNAICSDKTGTLTQNAMTVVQGWVAEEDFVVPGSACVGWDGSTEISGEGELQFRMVSGQVLKFLNEAVCMNSVAEEKKNEAGKLVWSGSKTEEGLLRFVDRIQNYTETRRMVSPSYKRSYPFSSAKKRMTTVVRTVDNRFLIYVKGASELVMQDCNTFLNAKGNKEPLTQEMQKGFLERINHMADQGNRTIAVAFASDVASAAFPETEPDYQLCLISILAMQDPIRPEVPDAVHACKTAGISVRMVTGDNLNTAIAIAKKCGIYQEDGVQVAITGLSFRDLLKRDRAEFFRMLKNLKVVARSSPSDKQELVEALVEQGDIVAVTGDGTNDAPALKKADVGFAMYGGTEVAKASSEMILMDDNFATVVKATMWGRTVNDNVRKFLQFQLTINGVGVFLTFIGSAILDNGQEPLTPVQLLWLNLIMDTLAALSLATEKPHPSCLKRLPYYRQSPLITKSMWVFIFAHGVFQLMITLLLLFFGQTWLSTGRCTLAVDGKFLAEKYASEENCMGSVKHRTVIFNVFILLQLFNQFNARSLFPGQYNIVKGVFSNYMFIVIFFVEIGFQIFAVEVAGKFMSTVPLDVYQWLGCCGIGLLEIPFGAVARLLAGLIDREHGKVPKRELAKH